MSVKYIDTMKNSRGVHARWAELIGSYSFTITHAKVIVEDCVSRCPSHLPEPTQEELDMEKDWEPDPPPHLDLEKLAAQSAKLQIRLERICHLEEEQICMNLLFGLNKVQVGWERSEIPETASSDWEDELGATISQLHHNHEETLVDWEHNWDWTRSGEKIPLTHVINKKTKYTTLILRYTTLILTTSWVQPTTKNQTIQLRQRSEDQEEHGHQCNKLWNPMNNAGNLQESKSIKLQNQFCPRDNRWMLNPRWKNLCPQRKKVSRSRHLPWQWNLVLTPIPDHQDVRIDTEGEGLGEPDPLMLARSPEGLSPATCQHIPGPRERTLVQDRDPVLSRVKDWIRQGIVPGRLELDFGEPSLKAYIKIMPVLKLKLVIPEPDEEDPDLDILVKTDIQGTVRSERYCLPE